MDPGSVERWVERYGRAWETQDAEAFAALFSDDALYAETPFAEPLRGREAIEAYAREGARRQRDVSFAHEAVDVVDDRVFVEWRASYTGVADDQPTRLSGIFVLEFAEDGRCRSLREWWHADPAPSFTVADLGVGPGPQRAEGAGSDAAPGSRSVVLAVVIAIGALAAVVFFLFR